MFDKSAYQQNRRANRIAAGVCIDCGLPAVYGIQRCAACRERSRANGVADRLRFAAKSSDLCVKCRERPSLATILHCRECYLNGLAFKHLGSGSLGVVLERKWDDQQGLCAYTKSPMIFGVNASIDHMWPLSRYPDRKNDPNNLCWALSRVNGIKGCMTTPEFLGFMQLAGEIASQCLAGTQEVATKDAVMQFLALPAQHLKKSRSDDSEPDAVIASQRQDDSWPLFDDKE